MSSVAAVTVGPSFFNTHTRSRALDPFQRFCAAPHLVRKTSASRSCSPLVFESPSPLPRETRSLDLDPRQRLPIGPQLSGSGSRSLTPTLAVSASPTPSSAKSSLDPVRSRETRALRRQGSIFDVPIALNPAANASSSSLASTQSLPSTSGEGALHPQQSTMSGPRETKNNTSPTRYRRANAPAPLKLNDAPSRLPSRRSISRPPTPRLEPAPAPPSKPKAQSELPSLPAHPQPKHARRRSRSATFLLSPSQANTLNTEPSFPTPLTPSFRFRVAEIPEQREKRMNKLTKTLGERVPSMLVFPSKSSASMTASSYIDLSTPDASVSGMRESTDASYPGRVKPDAHRRASKMLQALDLNSLPPAQKKNPKGASNWAAPTEWSLEPSEVKSDKRSSRRGGHGYGGEKEDDVLGIWNAESYDDVLERLRNLK